MKPRIIIVIFFCTLAGIARGQLSPVTGTGKSMLSTLQRAASRQKDSTVSNATQYVKPGKPVRTPAADTTPAARPKLPARAATESVPDDRSKLVGSLDRGSCKGVVYIPDPGAFDDVKVTPTPAAPKPPAPAPPHVPFLQIHGNVLYNLNYYSRIDTPYNERDIYQHTIQTWLDVLIKGQYPFRIYLTNHFSNSNLFRNYGDYNLSYNNSGFSQLLKEQVRKQFLASLPQQKVLDSLQNLLNQDLAKLRGLQGWSKNPGLIQKAVEARERSLRKDLPRPDSTSTGTAGPADEMDSIYAVRKREADSLRQQIEKLQGLLAGSRQKSKTEIDQTLQDIQRLDNPAALQKKLHALGMSDTSLPKGYKALMAIKSFNVGRTVVNYSELSVKNISVNGFQAEYNPSNYYAVATGSVDYRFRDFIVQGPGQAKQYLNVVRFGKGLKGGNSVILTYFTGRRQIYNASTTDSTNTEVPAAWLQGVSVEGNYRLNKNFLFTGEIAKSSSPYYSNDSSGKRNGGHLFSLSDHSNEAWALKLNADFPETHTKIKGTYKHLSANYQSFSIFTDGSAQSAWSINLNQQLFKKQLELNLGANTNDFTNPYIGQEYKSTTVFKSIQATLRKRNWPIISLGYFPSSQITKLGTSQYVENLFYTLIGNVTHSYTWHDLMMNTTVVYTQFYNRATDSGFTYFNTRNLLLSQTIFLGKLTLTGNASGATNQDYQLYTLEGKALHNITKILTIGAGVKYNKQTTYNIDQWGYSAEMTLRLNKLGQLQLTADKGFIPGMNKQLVPDNTGRLTYYKTF